MCFVPTLVNLVPEYRHLGHSRVSFADELNGLLGVPIYWPVTVPRPYAFAEVTLTVLGATRLTLHVLHESSPALRVNF